MPVKIKTDNHGKEIIWSEVGGKATPLPVENVYIRMGDGHVFTCPPGYSRGNTLQRLRPCEVAMVNFWLRKNAAEIGPNVFAGEPVADG